MKMVGELNRGANLWKVARRHGEGVEESKAK